MDRSAVEDVEYVVARLRKLLSPSRDCQCNPSGVVLLLGAGCSRQYGLPSFKELLATIYEDCYGHLPDASWNFETLRARLDGHWQTLGPEERRHLLARFLCNIHGSQCPGYLRLARLCQGARQTVRVIVNMNFDLLLEQALDAVGAKYFVTTRFSAVKDDPTVLFVVKPHGSIGSLGSKDEPNELILDIANSDLFAGGDEQARAQKLFTDNHVMSLGYSGVDAKIASALGNFPNDYVAREKKLFFVNADPADPRLFSVIARRTSERLVVTGEEGAFESFMEWLDTAPAQQGCAPRPRLTLFPEPTFMTRSEREALSKCLRLAQSIRAAINVADRSEKSIEEHGHDLYKLCLQLAAGSGLCLTPPERYILYCAAFLHDLGYFAAYGDGTAVERGWGLLTGEHGRKTVDLIRQRLDDEPQLAKELVPYRQKESAKDNRQSVLGTLLFICGAHSAFNEGQVAAALRRPELREYELATPCPSRTIGIAGGQIPLRGHLLQALFATAEELVKSHPFLPSADTVVAKDENRYAVEDPVLDFYLRQKQDEVTFQVQGRGIVAQSRGHSQETAKLLLTMACKVVERYNDVARRTNLERQETGALPAGASPCTPFLQLKLSDEQGEPVQDEGEPGRLLIGAFREKLREALDDIWKDFEKDARYLAAAITQDLTPGEPASRTTQLHLLRALHFPVTWLGEVESHLHRMVELSKRLPASEMPSPDLVASLRFHLDTVRRTFNPVRAAAGAGAGTAVLDEIQAAIQALRAAFEEIAVQGFEPIRKGMEDLEASFKAAREPLSKILIANGKEVLGLVADLVPKAADGPAGALRRRLGWLSENVGLYSRSEVASVLDVLAIYTLSTGGDEPRVDLRDEVVGQALDRIDALKLDDLRARGLQRKPRLPHHGLLPLYLPLARAYRQERKHGTEMERWFCKSFEEIIYPAWRFFARNWHDNIEPVLMARACLDLGSSRYRAEVVSGIRSLLGKKVEWSGSEAYGHDRCTLCTSRLLYIFSYARRLFPRDELKVFDKNPGRRGLDETIAGLLRYMSGLDRKSPVWWGIGSTGPDRGGIRSADYLSWAARALSFCFAVDQEVRERTGEDWLARICQNEAARLPELLAERWQEVFVAQVDDVLSREGEEPHSFILGHLALAYRDLALLKKDCPELDRLDLGGSEKRFLQVFAEAYGKSENAPEFGSTAPRGGPALLSRLYLWPASILYTEQLAAETGANGVAGREPEKLRNSREEMVRLCCECVTSPVWVRRGAPGETKPSAAAGKEVQPLPGRERDAGSWGFNTKNTQTIVTSLATFWRHAFDGGEEGGCCHFQEYTSLFEQHPYPEPAPGPGG